MAQTGEATRSKLSEGLRFPDLTGVAYAGLVSSNVQSEVLACSVQGTPITRSNIQHLEILCTRAAIHRGGYGFVEVARPSTVTV